MKLVMKNSPWDFQPIRNGLYFEWLWRRKCRQYHKPINILENIRTQSKARENVWEGARTDYEEISDWMTKWRAFAHPIISREGYANATTSTSKHTCELSRGKTENKLTRWCKRWKIFHFLTITWQDFRSTKLFLVLWSSVRLTNYIADVSRSFSVLGTNSNQEANSCKHKYEKTISGILSLQ